MEKMKLWEIMTPVDDKYKTSMRMPDGSFLTSVKPYEAMRRMTSIFGPMGYGWGAAVLEARKEGDTFQMRIDLWYKPHFVDPSIPISELAHIESWGGTEYNSIDWDMSKKAMTNAISKAISFLGFASPIYLGEEDRKLPPGQQPGTNPPLQTQSQPPKSDNRNIVAHDWSKLAQVFIDTKLPRLEGSQYHWRFVKEYEAYAFSLRNVPKGPLQEILQMAGFKFSFDKETRTNVFYLHVKPETLLSLEQSPEYLKHPASQQASSVSAQQQ